MLNLLNEYLHELKELRTLVKTEKSNTIAKESIRSKAKFLTTKWLSEISQRLENNTQISTETTQKYTDSLRELLRITGPNNLKSRYEAILKAIIKDFRDELILPLHEKAATSPSLSLLTSLFENLPTEEDEYLKESIGCAQHKFLKASTVLGWCTAINRIHRKIEEIGFDTFNVTSSQMASQQKGRFKKFNQVQNVQSIAELREVFDNIVLWIIEGMGLIDSNQHTRLRSCFDMRCQSAHPGDAPITEFNLLSFFSDIKEIILENPKFQLENIIEAE